MSDIHSAFNACMFKDTCKSNANKLMDAKQKISELETELAAAIASQQQNHSEDALNMVQSQAQQPAQESNADLIKQAVDKFLGWKLPKDFQPDCFINFDKEKAENHWPIGTHLLTAEQAKAMFEYCLPQEQESKCVDGGKCGIGGYCEICPCTGVTP